ncbi:MAG: hypothetical protein KDK55_06995, partial [Chlamydiia bacterium]|nr:hypothetical protein [Chlamydiia bacterium]
MKKNSETIDSIESEMMVLGCMITNQKYLELGIRSLTQDDFYVEEHIVIFKSLRKLHRENIPIEVTLLCKELTNVQILHAPSWPVLITSLAQYVGTSAHFEYYLLLNNLNLLTEYSSISLLALFNIKNC